MDAVVYQNSAGWWVSLRVLDREIDQAGPFDDEIDAVMMGERSVFGNGVVVNTHSLIGAV